MHVPREALIAREVGFGGLDVGLVGGPERPGDPLGLYFILETYARNTSASCFQVAWTLNRKDRRVGGISGNGEWTARRRMAGVECEPQQK